MYIATRTIALPVGERAARLGAMAKADLLAGMSGLRGVGASMGLMSKPDLDINQRQIEAELSSGRITWPFYIVFGQKPR